MSPQESNAEGHHTSAEWREHEHVSEHAQTEAERLLDAAGSAEIAKHAIDVVDQRKDVQGMLRDEFVQRMGMESYGALVAASVVIATECGQIWYVTPVPGGQWIAWSESDYREEQWDSQEAAIHSIQGNSGSKLT